MIAVRFFGVTRLQLNTDRLEMQASSIDELLEKISQTNKGMSLKELKDSIIFVNGANMIKLKLYKTELKDGDEVQIFSPAIGG